MFDDLTRLFVFSCLFVNSGLEALYKCYYSTKKVV